MLRFIVGTIQKQNETKTVLVGPGSRVRIVAGWASRYCGTVVESLSDHFFMVETSSGTHKVHLCELEVLP